MKLIAAIKQKPDIAVLAVVFLIMLVVTVAKSLNKQDRPTDEATAIEQIPEQVTAPEQAPTSAAEPEPETVNNTDIVTEVEAKPEPEPEPEPEAEPEPQFSGDPTKLSVEELQQCAEQGHGQCQLEMANRYVTGKGVKQDFEQSVNWYRLAADQGVAAAQFNLGNAYQRGRGVEKNLEAAKRYWARAAKQGLAAAQLNLGIRLVEERGINDELGLKLIKSAADQGHPSAQKTLKQIAEYKASLLNAR